MEGTVARVHLRLQGSAFSSQYPIEDVSAILLSVNRIIRKTSNAVLGEYGSHLRLEVLATFPRRGSYVQDLVLILDSIKQGVELIPAFAPLLPQVLQNAADAFALFKELLPLLHKGADKAPSITAPDNHGVVILNTGSGHVSVNQNVINAAAQSKEEYFEILKRLGPGITDVSVRGDDGSGFELRADDRKVIEFPKSRSTARHLANLAGELERLKSGDQMEEVLQLASDAPVSGVGDIISFDKERRTGRIRLHTGSCVPAGEYHFQLARRPETEQAILGMLHEHIHVSCHVLPGKCLEILQLRAERAIGATE